MKPTKFHKARPIEDFWSILKGEVYKNNWKDDNIAEPKERIKYCVKKFELNLIQKLTEDVYP